MQTQPHHVFIDTEDLEILKIHVIHSSELIRELCAGAINMRIIHVKTAHAHQTEQFTTLFIAVNSSVLSDPVWKITVTFGLRLEDLMVMRAVHRFQVVLLAIKF